jgi:hypothetical protein
MTSSPALLDSATFADVLLEVYGWSDEAVEAFVTAAGDEEFSYNDWVLMASAYAATSPVRVPSPFF